ncbi:MAG: hypothetical protein FJW40_05140 [Acidobacteria bacterium]|nr:hypothetical protein [Acidobacteriota bacterium]
MAKPGLIEVACPCCKAALKIDTATETVITFKEAAKAPAFEDFGAAVQKLKGEAARRDEAFQKSMRDERQRKDVLNKKFDELFKQVKEGPDTGPPRKDIDFD